MNEKREKESFVMHQSWESTVQMMTDEQAGMLLKTIFEYQHNPEARPSDPAVAFAFEMIRVRMDEDRTHYEETCKKRSEAGKNGNKKRWKSQKSQKVANDRKCDFCDSTGSQTVANIADTDTDTDTDTLLLTEKSNSARVRARGSQEEQKSALVSSCPPGQSDVPSSHGIDLDGKTLTGMFKDPAMADAMLTWLKIRAEQGRFPYGSVTAAIEQAKAAEKKYGSERCIPVIQNAISGAYKRIIWEELESRGRSGPPNGKPKGRELDQTDINDIERKLLALGG